MHHEENAHLLIVAGPAGAGGAISVYTHLFRTNLFVGTKWTLGYNAKKLEAKYRDEMVPIPFIILNGGEGIRDNTLRMEMETYSFFQQTSKRVTLTMNSQTHGRRR